MDILDAMDASDPALAKARAAAAAATAARRAARNDADTVGSLLAAIATALQDALRLLVFADKRGWGPDEFEQVRAVEEALDEAKRDFQAMAPLVNGQLYYENDRRVESLDELRALRARFDDHVQAFRDWLRSGGPINPLWVRETVALRRQLHRAQCRAARRIFNAEHDAGDDSSSGARCLGAFLVYRRLRELEAARRRWRQQLADVESVGPDDAAAAADTAAFRRRPRHAGASGPVRLAWQQPPRRPQPPSAAGREPFRGQDLGPPPPPLPDGDGSVVLEMTPRNGNAARPRPILKPTPTTTATSVGPYTSTTPPISADARPYAYPNLVSSPTEPAHTTIPLNPDEPPSPPPPPPTLEDLVPDCTAVGSFQRFGDQDIAFVCDYCDGHIVWEDVQRLPTTRAPPPSVAGGSSAAAAAAAAAASARSASISSSASLSTNVSTTTLPFFSGKLSPSPPQSRPSPVGSVPPRSAPGRGYGGRASDVGGGYLDDDNDPSGYPRWQASTVAMSDPRTPRTVVFAPLAIANHLPPVPGAWEARLWCPFCDEYLYFDSAEGDQTKYAQDEHGFASLADFQAHLEWHHTALPVPALPLPTPSSSCSMM